MRELIVTCLIVGLVGLGLPAVSQVRAQQYEPTGNISGIAFRAPCLADDEDTLIALEHLPEEEDGPRLRGTSERLADPDFLLGSTEDGSEDEVTVVRQWRYNDDEDTDDHNPIEDYLVRLRNLNTGEIVAMQTRTTTSGDFLFTGLIPGDLYGRGLGFRWGGDSHERQHSPARRRRYDHHRCLGALAWLRRCGLVDPRARWPRCSDYGRNRDRWRPSQPVPVEPARFRRASQQVDQQALED